MAGGLPSNSELHRCIWLAIDKEETTQTFVFAGPHGSLGSALKPAGGASGADTGAPRAAGREIQLRSNSSARASESRFLPLWRCRPAIQYHQPLLHLSRCF
ncbi:unnamed protein product [Prorocentrum cordatum]|uniref:Uncharacterized protein n=1 Tax=Prorocentrum cordatum TaxID=2364126 RepID=A0ABN9URH3_9DINO|nr:unnamed protein product [Polarella glacialis]